MKNKISLQIHMLIGITVFAFSNSSSNGQNNQTNKPQSIKLDLASSYYTLFDNKQQLKIGVEFEKGTKSSTFFSYYLDFGLYDNYKFIKYYDFFNQLGGLYSVQNKVSIYGLHIMPGYNRYFLQSKRKTNQGMFIGGIADISLYQKSTKQFNTQSLDRSTIRYMQLKTGIGFSFGLKRSFTKRLFVEAKTSIITKVWNVLSDKERVEIASLNAQWTHVSKSYWWVTNLKLGYALFKK